MPSGGASAVASSSPRSCAGVTCPALPNSCKKIVQDPTACCPVCTDTGCPTCSPPNCLTGMHLETLPGDCCPSCVADPLDDCKKGQQEYDRLRMQLQDKYASTKCQNSTECTLVSETNACTAVCFVPLPTATASNYLDNLASSAKSNCASCPPPPMLLCPNMVPACLNGKCVAVNPS
jgi:hypothetical protein